MQPGKPGPGMLTQATPGLGVNSSIAEASLAEEQRLFPPLGGGTQDLGVPAEPHGANPPAAAAPGGAQEKVGVCLRAGVCVCVLAVAPLSQVTETNSPA